MSENIDEIIKNLRRGSLEYFHKHYTNGGSCEFDTTINDISRAMIVAYHKKHGKCFLGKINDYDKYGTHPKIEFTPYTGQEIYNFEFAFVISDEDEELRRMLTKHNTQKKYDAKSAYRLIDQITCRIAELGGEFLSWS